MKKPIVAGIIVGSASCLMIGAVEVGGFTLARSVAVNSDGGYTGIQLSPVIVDLPDNMHTAFGAGRVSEESNVISLQFPYNINTALVTSTVSGGTITASPPFAVLQTSTGASNYARLNSKKTIKYVPGQGVVARWTSVFTTGVANSRQYSGIGNTVDGFFFGYSGTTFGIGHRNAGVTTHIPQSSWNVDPMNGTGPSRITLDPTKGNVYQTQFQWLGFGAIRFYVESNTTGELNLVHIIRYANANTATSLSNPTLGLYAEVVNSGNTSNLTLKIPSMGAFYEGEFGNGGLPAAVQNRKTGVTTATNIVTIRNNTTFASVTNFVRVKLVVSIGVSTATDIQVKLVLNTTLGGSPSYTDFDTNTSVVAYDTAGTTITGGRNILAFSGEANAAQTIDLSKGGYYLEPGDTLTSSAASITGNAAVQVAFNWAEEF